MIRSESEYQQALKGIEAERARFVQHAGDWKKQGYTDEQVAKLMEPLESFHRQLVEEARSYERLKRGQFSEFENLEGLGQILIGVRIARGMTQRQLAERLGCDETAVSRDERNEYRGIRIERARKILEALGVRLLTRVEVEPLSSPSEEAAAEQPHAPR